MNLVQISYTLKDIGQLKALTLFALLISEELQFNGVMLPIHVKTQRQRIQCGGQNSDLPHPK
jgi:hypothetical protein